jgi:hypothetical protein
VEVLPASHAWTLIPVIPRTSAEAASWGLRELSFLLPFVARPGLELDVHYTQDGDDLGESGGDGGPPQVVQAQAPSFPVFGVPAEPQPPIDPNALTAKLYCERLTAWERRANRALRVEAAHRTAAALAWARTVAARLLALADRPISDTAGSEANVEFDAGASVFAAVQVAMAAPRPNILFLGGLTTLAPPSQKFGCPAHFVALVRSTDPTHVLHAVKVWSRWITRCGGTFQAASANDTPTEIAKALMN